MFARFFINRPVFANVIAIVIMVVGAIAVVRLPVEQVPQITPPTIRVSATYPGADAKTVAETVAAPIELQVNGVEGMMYMSSTCASDGSYGLTVTFEVGTNLDMAQVLVQNRVAIAMPLLPPEVQKQGVTTKKQSTAITMFVCFFSPDERYDSLYLSNFATLRVRDELSRLPGVGDIFVIPSADYSMRVWLDPEKLQARGLTTQDVIAAIQEQNVQVAAGQVGQPPSPPGQNLQMTVTVKGRLQDAAEFENIILKSAPDGGSRLTRLKDVARVELGGKIYDQYFLISGKPAAGIAVFQLPGANALDVAAAVREKMEELKKGFPEGLEYTIPLDTTKFVSAAIHEVYKTLFEAGILVLLVILIFLQDFRAVLVPASTVPITIIGAFFAMGLLGFSINMLTMFGLVLAIGIVVDDAIVIVEGAAHNVERGLEAKPATIKAMDELIGPIVGITLVLMAVFLPTVFLGGITGRMYQQFALTIAATALISAISAVTLQPAQCGKWLRKAPEKRNFFFRGFNYVYGRCEDWYYRLIRQMVRFSLPAMIVYAGLIGFAVWLFQSLPTGFLPTEDQGYLMIGVQLPDGATLERTREVVDRVRRIALETTGVENITQVGGQSIDGTVTPTSARCFVRFKDWTDRRTRELSQEALLAKLRSEFGKIQEGEVFVFEPPAIRGLGMTGGFQMQIQDRGEVGPRDLQAATEDLVAAAREQPELNANTMRTTYRGEVPQVFVDVDRTKAKTMDMSLGSVFSTLQAYMGAAYVNDFNRFGRTYQVRVQADRRFRTDAEQISRLRARNRDGKTVPLGAVADVRQTTGPDVIMRYNLYPTANVIGAAAPGRSSGEALAKMEQLADNLPSSVGSEWTGMAYQERKVGGQGIFVFGMAVLLVYLVLAAQYESWTSPAAVILVVPLGLLGAAVAVALRGMDNNMYTQIGVVLIIALASKNAILIVEYARHLRAAGKSIADAAAEASRRRFRPILMTSFAFILGVVPLLSAEGAGAASRRALGTTVFGGMIASTVLAVAFVPVFYVVLQRLAEFVSRKPAVAPSPAQEPPATPET
jgi:HAE1 family hydrophobic/amphiphilic exporter-1